MSSHVTLSVKQGLVVFLTLATYLVLSPFLFVFFQPIQVVFEHHHKERQENEKRAQKVNG